MLHYDKLLRHYFNVFHFDHNRFCFNNFNRI